MEMMEFKNEGLSIDACCKRLGFGRSTFYQRKYVTEMLLVDQHAFDVLKQKALDEKKFLEFLNKECKEKLQMSPYKNIAKEMRGYGMLLP